MSKIILTDNWVKGILALVWSLFAMWAMAYIIIRFGQEKEILTLIIGIISGTILGGIFGVYFASALMQKHPTNLPQGTTTAKISAEVVTEPDTGPEIKKE